MNELFASVKADLTDRRLLPIVAAVSALLVAALAYALLGGGGSSSSSGGPVPAPTPQLPSGIAVTGAKARTAVAETTDGFSDQKRGVARNPFAPLPGSEAPEASTSSASSPSESSSGSSSSSTSSSTSGEGSEPSSGSGSEPSSSGGSGTPTSNGKSKTKTVYDVTIKLGTLPPGITPETAQLHEYTKLRLQTPLPSAQVPLLVFRGVTAKGRSATFTLVGEAILTGAGTCMPSPFQCQAVNLKPGETEQMNAIGPNGESTLYELRVLSIEPQKAQASRAKASAASRHASTGQWGVSRVGQGLLRKAGLVALPFLHYSSQPGVLVFNQKTKKPHAGR